MNIGFIGTGNMGTILIEALIESKAVNPSFLSITNRTLEKAKTLKNKYPEIQLAETPEDVILQSELIFLCVKPLDIYPFLSKHSRLFTEKQCLITITSPIRVDQIEQIVPCQTARIIPSITNRAFAGISLITYGSSCTDKTKTNILQLLKGISLPVQIEERITRVASDIVSCGPAFFSYLVQRFIDAAVAETNISHAEATVLSKEMLVGLGKLLEKEHYTLPSLQEKVCVKGGVTGEGIKALDEGIGDMFHRLFRSTHTKFEEDLSLIKKQFPASS
ncbi:MULTISPECIES: late competence protein ComER [Bacillus]|uniref:Competence protein n=2 Tax=Bacillus TaxID=1386 RepID=A0A0M4FJL1_9BACI|nr:MULTISPECIES: late competence protein ComER [Bacillus]ALC81691.1 competence protein [Bacillus gobiensis]MBP1080744.1 competence protein ComER [Bacillus capparidis]MED1094599.1 late competence protein ComER [Bacillus capparidis]